MNSEYAEERIDLTNYKNEENISEHQEFFHYDQGVFISAKYENNEIVLFKLFFKKQQKLFLISPDH